MQRKGDSRNKGRYPLAFGVAAVLLVSVTLILVLVVLPRRYVLDSGFQESGISFPTSSPPVDPSAVIQRPAPAIRRPTRPVAGGLESEPAPKGPAELFWEEILPLLRAEAYGEALPVFRDYLSAYPDDRDVRREYLAALLAAGEEEAAVDVLVDMLATQDDPEVRLLLARVLRDQGRMAAASSHYALLQGTAVDGTPVALEWGQALAWQELYGDAVEVLRNALGKDPRSASLRVELARTLYAAGGLDEAAALLEEVPADSLIGLDAVRLRDDVRAALVTPEPPFEPEPTLLESAMRARVAGDRAAADSLFRRAVSDAPEDAEAWARYADFLQYDEVDPAGAYRALLEVERLQASDRSLQFRLAQLEIWTNRTPSAETRLAGLAAAMAPGDSFPVDPRDPERGSVTRPDVLGLLGDVRRWQGRRLDAATTYRLAEEEDPGHAGAAEGLATLDAEVAAEIERFEAPRAGGAGSALFDSDDFRRVDAGAEWIGVRGLWSWSARGGNRWFEGYDELGGRASDAGPFAELSGARWWRLGTVRTGVTLGVESVRPGREDLTLGGSLRVLRSGGAIIEAEVERGPGHEMASTLQSIFLEAVHDHLRVAVQAPVAEAWTVWTEFQLGRFDPGAVIGVDPVERVQGAFALGRRTSTALTLGLAGRALGYSGSVPDVGGRPLLWDPELVFSAGPYAQWTSRIGAAWEFDGRLAPGVALIDEGDAAGRQTVPHFSAEGGVRYRGRRFWTALDLFYFQGKFDGYRSWGARLSLSVRDWLPGGVQR